MEKTADHIFNLTSSRIYRIIALGLFFIALGLILVFQHRYYSNTYGERDLEAFERVLHGKEQVISESFEKLAGAFKENPPLAVLGENSEEFRKLANDGIYIFYYEKNRLKYWSDHNVPLRPRWSARLKSPVYETLNGTYVAVRKPVGDDLLYGLILVRNNYLFENKYLESDYQEDFLLDNRIGLERQTGPALSDVHNLDGDYLFSLDLHSNLRQNDTLVVLSLLMFMLGIVAFFVFFILKTDAAREPAQRNGWFSIGAIAMLAISFVVIYLEVPRIIFEADFFRPGIYASLTFSSMGHLWIFVLLVLMIVLQFYWFFDRSRRIPENFRTPLAAGMILTGSLWFVFAHQVSKSLVIDSTISFEAYKLDSLSMYTFSGLLIILMACLVFILFFYKALHYFEPPFRTRQLLIILLPGLLAQVVFLFTDAWHLEPVTPLFFIFIAAALVYLRSRKSKLKFSSYFLLIMLFSVFITIDLQKHTSEKLDSVREIELAKLSSQHDAVAEMLFSSLTDTLQTDSLLISRLSYEIIDVDRIYEYLQRVYFSGYWTKYDMAVTLCRPPDSVFIETPSDRWYPCYDFFGELVIQEGIKVEESDFYFLNNLNGRISYLGVIPYNVQGDEITLFLELNSKIISEELGYPSLLMKQEDEPGEPFSYAKYNGGKLITSGGVYNYRLTPDYYTRQEYTFEEVRTDGYDHSIFNVDPENTVIVSVPVVSVVDYLISLSYMFAYIFLLFTLSYLLVSASEIRTNVTWDFKNKIQYSMIGVLFLTFLVICSGTIWFITQQYKMKHHDTLQNTMRSLYIELVHKVEYEEDLRNWSSESYYNLNELLRKFSNVFYTDINMYDEEGMLLATSRSEIFEQELLSARMDREAFEKLSGADYSAYIHTESIGKMTYQSAYVPLLNSENKFLAYLNLPYFTQPEILAQEVSNLVVAILNTYVILLLLILFLSVFLADRITQPLRFIQSRIAQLSLSDINEKIVYRGRDEIAGLVDEYNYMVDELVKSAELLAQSERESAWREMAKQIAHEIKNPLTPMKLNVQHMQRMIGEDTDNIQEKVNRVSQMLIDQIDSLTAIANEFSDFAKMPKARNKQIDLLKRLESVVSLFGNSEGVSVALDLGTMETARSYGDPEQFQRVIINLVKNGIQSVPEGREKKVRISIEPAPEDTVLITVSDNGRGIPTSIQDKLFQPNFTTKTSGMGMGLAIAANIVKSMGGNIWYRTKEGEGTEFFIKLPLVT